VSNALAAISISLEVGIPLQTIQSGLLKFKGVGRRLEKLYEKDQFLIIDDYGHHPTEVKATVSSLRSVDQRPLCVIFEPHRYSRTQNFWKEFQECFEGVDELYLGPIYPASENPIPGITSEAMVNEMKAKGKKVDYLPSLDEMDQIIKDKKSKNYLVVTLGAGSISKKIREMVKKI
jgi:UDP-N-acetylmuramate--alanine ligase